MPKKVFLFGSYNAFSYQPETTAYLTALAVPNDSTVYFNGFSQQILGSVVWTKIDAFVITLKNAYGLTLGLDNLKTKVPAIYPFWGGTATMTKFNLADAQDTNGAFRIGWNGGVTHSRTGVAFNGSNAYGNTYLTPNTKFGANFYGFVYSINSYTSNVLMGGRSSSAALFDFTGSGGGGVSLDATFTTASGVSAGITSLYRTGSTQVKYRRNGAQQTLSSNYLATMANNVYVGAYNDFGTGVILYSNANLKTYSIISQPSDADITTLENAITQLNIDLNR
jgi:hypothetical protein